MIYKESHFKIDHFVKYFTCSDKRQFGTVYESFATKFVKIFLNTKYFFQKKEKKKLYIISTHTHENIVLVPYKKK